VTSYCKDFLNETCSALESSSEQAVAGSANKLCEKLQKNTVRNACLLKGGGRFQHFMYLDILYYIPGMFEKGED
jgi:hypothetical protein